jgi:hypothetical protein
VDVEEREDLEDLEVFTRHVPWKCLGSPTSRTYASINAAHVVMAFELADT